MQANVGGIAPILRELYPLRVPLRWRFSGSTAAMPTVVWPGLVEPLPGTFGWHHPRLGAHVPHRRVGFHK